MIINEELIKGSSIIFYYQSHFLSVIVHFGRSIIDEGQFRMSQSNYNPKFRIYKSFQ